MMKNIFFSFATTFLLAFNATAQSKVENDIVKVAIDLVNIKDDKVLVSVKAPTIVDKTVNYHLPKTVPGTYSTDDYGRLIDDFKAFDKKGKALSVTKADLNTWTISGTQNLDKITYFVNDTYDIEGELGVFSPSGTNIAADNIVLNMHGFVGYFSTKTATPYQVTVTHPATLIGITALNDADVSDTIDQFSVARYAELADNPVMYSKPDFTLFTVNDMEILFSVYSPTGKYTAAMLSPEVEKMIRAQKKFLGDINKTPKYAILLYLSDVSKPDASGFGALEHNTSTTVVFPEAMGSEQLITGLIDVISHEFFHTLTPLSVHSKEIHDFDFANPKMSEHLWMYEGVTEYFANLFQVNQGLITDEEFYNRTAEKIENASKMNDAMSFTKMSSNVLTSPYKEQYRNVYEKGALIGMCIDIIIREKSNGERGILDMMRKLSNEYGPQKPFNDADLLPKIANITYPEVDAFIKKHVVGDIPIPYDEYFAKMGVTKIKKQVPSNVFIDDKAQYIAIKPNTKDIVVLNRRQKNKFLTTLGLEGGDVIMAINGKDYDLDNVEEMVENSLKWEENSDITLKIKRDGKEMTIKGKVKHEFEEKEALTASDEAKKKVREAWLRG